MKISLRAVAIESADKPVMLVPKNDPAEGWDYPADGDWEIEPEPGAVACLDYPMRWRPGRSSPRREKLFRRAERVMRTAARLAGRDAKPVAIFGRGGRKIGLFLYLGPDSDMYWTPRDGFRVRPVEPIPF